MADRIKKFIEENQHRLKIRSKSSRPARDHIGQAQSGCRIPCSPLPAAGGRNAPEPSTPEQKETKVIKPIKPKRQVFAEPVTSIEAKGYREYFRKVDETAAASADYLHTHRAVTLRGPASVIVVQVPLGHSPAQTGYSKPCPCCFLYIWHGPFGFRGSGGSFATLRKYSR